jgi:hypothetical protein
MPRDICHSRSPFLLSFAIRASWLRWRSRGQFRDKSRSLLFLVFVLCCAVNGEPSWAQLPACTFEMPPSGQLREVFRDVQLQRIFEDSKTFADLHYSESPSTVRADYQAHRDDVDFDLSRFVQEHFSATRPQTTRPFCRCLIRTSYRVADSGNSIIGIRTSPCWAWKQTIITTSRLTC